MLLEFAKDKGKQFYITNNASSNSAWDIVTITNAQVEVTTFNSQGEATSAVYSRKIDMNANFIAHSIDYATLLKFKER